MRIAIVLFLSLSCVGCNTFGELDERPGEDDSIGVDGESDGDQPSDEESDTVVPQGICNVSNPTEFEEQLLAIPADSWWEAPGTEMLDACPNEPDLFGDWGCEAVVEWESGGAYNRAGNQLLLWGGGEPRYLGNEVYSFDLTSGTWSTLTEPSPASVVDEAGDPLSDGKPQPRASHDTLLVLEHTNELWMGRGNTFTLDLSSGEWTERLDIADDIESSYWAAAYDPVTRLAFVRTHEELLAWDRDQNTVETVISFGERPLYPRYQIYPSKTMTLDSKRRLLWSVGNGDIFIWDIDGEKIVADAWDNVTGGGDYSNEDHVEGDTFQLFESGGAEIYDSSAPGIAYDPVGDALVAWTGSGGPWALDLEARVWTQKSADGVPSPPEYEGIYGRWQYVPRYNVFILVTEADENVHFYRHTACPE